MNQTLSRINHLMRTSQYMAYAEIYVETPCHLRHMHASGLTSGLNESYSAHFSRKYSYTLCTTFSSVVVVQASFCIRYFDIEIDGFCSVPLCSFLPVSALISTSVLAVNRKIPCDCVCIHACESCIRIYLSDVYVKSMRVLYLYTSARSCRSTCIRA